MSDFSSMPLAKDYFAPARFDVELFDCEIAGTVPADLNGAFYRMHPDWIYAPLFPDEASLSADGYMSVFRFKRGMVDYRGRYIRTARYEHQRTARRQLYGYYRNPYTDDPQVRNLDNPNERTSANTTPVILSQTFTAHPKFDPRTRETIAFGYEASGLASRDVLLCTFDSAGRITSEMRFDVPHTTMLHDIAITDRHVIVPGGSAVTSAERLREGKIHWGWDRTRESFYAIVPRGGRAGDIRWFRGPERSIVHTANAWSEGRKIYLDLPLADGNTWPFFPEIHGAPFKMHPNTIRRLTFDLDSGSDECREERLFEQEVTSFTRIDDRFATRPHRYIYVQYVDRSRRFRATLPQDPRALPTNSVARFDLQDGSMRSFFVGEAHVVQEPTFVPRAGGHAEGDGYLLATVHNLESMRCELVIVDAMELRELARVLLPFRNPSQVHGLWATEQDLPLG
jgi:carotenoid cleavage dioxygenase-like enzyme